MAGSYRQGAAGILRKDDTNPSGSPDIKLQASWMPDSPEVNRGHYILTGNLDPAGHMLSDFVTHEGGRPKKKPVMCYLSSCENRLNGLKAALDSAFLACRPNELVRHRSKSLPCPARLDLVLTESDLHFCRCIGSWSSSTRATRPRSSGRVITPPPAAIRE